LVSVIRIYGKITMSPLLLVQFHGSYQKHLRPRHLLLYRQDLKYIRDFTRRYLCYYCKYSLLYQPPTAYWGFI